MDTFFHPIALGVKSYGGDVLESYYLQDEDRKIDMQA
jgi:hypothetical protein